MPRIWNFLPFSTRGQPPSLEERTLGASRRRLTHVESMRRLISYCVRELDLDKGLKRKLEKLEDVLIRRPEKAAAAVAKTRAAFRTPVPGLVY